MPVVMAPFRSKLRGNLRRFIGSHQADGEGAIRTIERKHFRHLAYLTCSFARLPEGNSEEQIHATSLIGGKHIAEALRHGRGALLVMDHFGNGWHVLAGLASSGHPVTLLVNPTFSPTVQRQILRICKRLGIDAVHPGPDAYRNALAVLAENGVFLLAFDAIDDSKNSVPLRFGHTALRVPRGPALLALRSGTTVLKVTNNALPTGESETTILPLLNIPTLVNPRGDSADLIEKWVKDLEERALSTPEQWGLWSYVSAGSSPPGPSRRSLLGDYMTGRHKSLPYFLEMRRRYGATVKLPLKIPTFVLFEPADIKRVLVTNPGNYAKTGGLVVGSALFGNGLLSSEGTAHANNRRLIQPMFHSQRIGGFAKTMTSTIEEMSAEWESGKAIDASAEMMRMTLRIVGRTLFSVDLSTHLRDLGESVVASQRFITDRIWKPIRLQWNGGSTGKAEYRRATGTLDTLIYDMIAQRRGARSRPDDLLTMLIESRYEDGTAMSDAQARDEIATFIAAGHETTANALAWAWYLLALNPAAEEALVDEFRCELGGRIPEAADIPRLRYTEMVISESMRLYPPVWLLARRVVGEDLLPGGAHLPAGSQIVIIPYVTHRDPSYFPEPEVFRPERFGASSRHELQFIYLPFSAGPRGCIGEPFARMEAILLLATVAQRWKLTLEPPNHVEPELLQTLRPKNGIPMRLHRRS